MGGEFRTRVLMRNSDMSDFARSFEHPGDLLPISAFADVSQRLGLVLGAVLFGVVAVVWWHKARRHDSVDLGSLGKAVWFDLVANGNPMAGLEQFPQVGFK